MTAADDARTGLDARPRGRPQEPERHRPLPSSGAPLGLRPFDTTPLGGMAAPRSPLRSGPLGPAHPGPTPPGSRPVGGAARAAGPSYKGLRGPVRVALWATATIVIGAALGATAPTALRRLGAVAVIQPGLLSWYAARALGLLAYVVVAGSVLYGLLLSTKILDAIAHRPVSFALHKDLALAGLFLGVLHSVVLLADRSFAFTPRAILVPFSSPYAPVWVGVGQLAIYGLAVVTASFYVRRQIGQRAWRLIHYVTFAVFVGTTVHGVMAGSDSGAPWALWVYLVPSALAIFLLVYRIVLSVSAHQLHPSAEHPAVPVLVARAPLPPSARRVAPGRPAVSINPPFAGPTFD